MRKTTDEVWDPQRQVILVVNMLFCIIGITQSLLSSIGPEWEHYWPYPVFIELNKAWVRALLALPSPYWAK